jgi:hypothetical protein
VAARHRRHIPEDLEATLQLAPQSRAIRKHIQGDLAGCGLTWNWHDAHAFDCEALPDELSLAIFAQPSKSCAKSEEYYQATVSVTDVAV